MILCLALLSITIATLLKYGPVGMTIEREPGKLSVIFMTRSKQRSEG